MKTTVILAVLSLLICACTTLPPITGEFSSKAGQLKVYPDGKFEIVVQPRTGK